MIRSRILLVCSILCVAGCNESPSLSTVQVQPSSAALTFVGQSVQFQAIGTYQQVGHPSNTQDISGSVTWTSSNPGAATITATGLATAVSNGSTMITAKISSYGGAAIGTATLSISGETAHDLTSITIVPGGQATERGRRTRSVFGIWQLQHTAFHGGDYEFGALGVERRERRDGQFDRPSAHK